MKTEEFMHDATRRSGQFADWKDKGKIIFFLHTKSEIGKRVRIMFRLPAEADGGGVEIRSFYRFFKGKGDVTAQFLKWLKSEEKIPNETVVLEARAGDDVERYMKGDLIGSDEKDKKGKAKFDWRRRLLSPRTDYLFCVVDKDDPKGTQILNMPKSAGEKFGKLLKSQIEEYGVSKGDPFVEPWAVKLSYDEKGQPADRYFLERHQAEPTEAHLAIFENEEPDDILAICDEAQDVGEELQSVDLLRMMLKIPCPLFDDLEEEKPPQEPEVPAEKTAKPPEKPKIPAGKTPAKKAADAKKKTAPKATKEKPDKAKTKKVKKVAQKPEPEPPAEEEDEGTPCGACQRMVPDDAQKCPWADCGVEYESDDNEVDGSPYVEGDGAADGDDIPF